MTRQNTNTLPAGAAFGVKYRFSGMLLVLVKSGEAAVSINDWQRQTSSCLPRKYP